MLLFLVTIRHWQTDSHIVVDKNGMIITSAAVEA
jgi:hypothetical protein